jgi:hypothetical protein
MNLIDVTRLSRGSYRRGERKLRKNLNSLFQTILKSNSKHFIYFNLSFSISSSAFGSAFPRVFSMTLPMM